MLHLSKTSLAWLCTFFASTALVACGSDDTDSSHPIKLLVPPPTSQVVCAKIPDDPTKPFFTHDRTDALRGPAAWGQILAADGTVAYPACADATHQQAPIALPSPEMPWVVGGVHLDRQTLSWSNEAAVTSLIDNGHTWLASVAPTPPNTITYQGEPFALQQFHVHAPSEHTLGGQSFPMEMHLVHRGGNGAYAVVVALLFEESDEDNPVLAKLWNLFSRCPQTESTPTPNLKVDLGALLPENTSHFEYDGSLTTPPCTRVVHFFVVTQPISASADQIAAFADALGQTNRPTESVIDEQRVTYEIEN